MGFQNLPSSRLQQRKRVSHAAEVVEFFFLTYREGTSSIAFGKLVHSLPFFCRELQLANSLGLFTRHRALRVNDPFPNRGFGAGGWLRRFRHELFSSHQRATDGHQSIAASWERELDIAGCVTPASVDQAFEVVFLSATEWRWNLAGGESPRFGED